MPIQLQNVDDKGNTPETRIKDAQATFRVYQLIEDAWKVSLANQRIIDDEIAGAPPSDPDDLAAAGLGWTSNINSLQAAADDDAATSSYVSLNDATPHLMSVHTGYGDESERYEWQEKISRHLDWLFKKRYASFHQNEQLLAKWYTRDGFAVVYWPHDMDWRWKVGRLGQFLFPADALVDESLLDIALFVEDKTPPELFQMLRKSKAVTDRADKSAVNQKEVIKAIVDAGSMGAVKNLTYSDLEARFANNMVGEAYGSTQRLTIVHLYVREFPEKNQATGKVSHYIIRADGKSKDFLYKKRNAFPCMEQMMTFYADGVGTGTIGSLQGQVAKSFPHYIATDLTLNKWIDHTHLNANIYMKGDGSAGSVELLAQQALGSITVLAPKTEFVPLPATDTGAQCTPLLAELNRIRANNNGAYQSHAVSPEGGDRTLGEVNLQAAASAQLQGAKQTNLYLSKDPHYNNVINRLKKIITGEYTSADPGWREGMDFFKRLEDDGVPLQAFLKINDVTPMRAVGYGSFQARQAAFGTLNGLRGFMDPTGQANLNRDMAAAGGAGYDNAARYFGTPAQPRTSGDQKIADLQNVGFASGVPSPVYPDDNHPIHAIEHDKFGNALIGQVSQGAIDIAQALKGLGALLDHQKASSSQAPPGHLDYIAKSGDGSKKELLKDLTKSWQNLVKQFQALQQAHAQQQPANQVPQISNPVALLTAMGSALKDGAPIPNEDFAQVLGAAGLNSQMPLTPQQVGPSPADQAAAAKAQAEISRNDAEAAARIQRDDATAHAAIATAALKAGAASHPGPLNPAPVYQPTQPATNNPLVPV